MSLAVTSYFQGAWHTSATKMVPDFALGRLSTMPASHAFVPCHATAMSPPMQSKTVASRCLCPDAYRCLRHRLVFAPGFVRSRPASSLHAMSRYRDAQLPSPSAPTQSKTVSANSIPSNPAGWLAGGSCRLTHLRADVKVNANSFT